MSALKIPLLVLLLSVSAGALFGLSIWTSHQGVHWLVAWAIFTAGGAGYASLIELWRELPRLGQ